MFAAVSNFFQLVSIETIKYMRNSRFFILISLILFLAYMAVPAASAGYQVFYISGVRGEYNSAWLGGMGTMLSTIFIWLFGFYMLKNRVTNDSQYKLMPLISSSPVRNLTYLSSKFLSNFFIVMTIHVILMASFLIMQLLRGENYSIEILDYIGPTLYLIIPSFAMLSAIAILFDTTPGLKGTTGNILFFFLWLILSVMSLEKPDSFIDIFGIDVIRSDMVNEAGFVYGEMVNGNDGGSFGYYPMNQPALTFEWQGIDWSLTKHFKRGLWIVGAILLTLLSTVMFNAFPPNNKSSSWLFLRESKNSRDQRFEMPSISLTSIVKTNRVNLMKVVQYESLFLIKKMSLWWHLVTIAIILFCLFAPMSFVKAWLPVMMIWPLSAWSHINVKEKRYGVIELLRTTCSPIYPFFAAWVSGVCIATIVSLGVIIRFLIAGDYLQLLCWLIACFFIPALASALGAWSGSEKMFEVIYMIWWYLGPVNGMSYVDFSGVATPAPLMYSAMTIILLAIAYVGVIRKPSLR